MAGDTKQVSTFSAGVCHGLRGTDLNQSLFYVAPVPRLFRLGNTTAFANGPMPLSATLTCWRRVADLRGQDLNCEGGNTYSEGDSGYSVDLHARSVASSFLFDFSDFAKPRHCSVPSCRERHRGEGGGRQSFSCRRIQKHAN
jgi:hypothetical protein